MVLKALILRNRLHTDNIDTQKRLSPEWSQDLNRARRMASLAASQERLIETRRSNATLEKMDSEDSSRPQDEMCAG